MTQRELFSGDLSTIRPPKQPPHNGRDTSRAAAESAKSFAGQQRERVYQFIEQAGDHGATNEEVELGTGLAGNSVRPRTRELVQLGRVKDSGQRRNTCSGRAATVWAAVCNA